MKTSQESKQDYTMVILHRPSASSKPNNRKSNEYSLSLCIGFVDYEKAFDTVERPWHL